MTLGSSGQFGESVLQLGQVPCSIESVSVVSNGLEDASIDILALFPRAFLIAPPMVDNFEACARILLYNMALACDVQASLLEATGDW